MIGLTTMVAKRAKAVVACKKRTMLDLSDGINQESARLS